MQYLSFHIAVVLHMTLLISVATNMAAWLFLRLFSSEWYKHSICFTPSISFYKLENLLGENDQRGTIYGKEASKMTDYSQILSSGPTDWILDDFISRLRLK